MSAWINAEYYVLSSMPSLALNSITLQAYPVALHDDSSLLAYFFDEARRTRILIPGACGPHITLGL